MTERRFKMSKVLLVTCPSCGAEFEIEAPKMQKTPRGCLAGIPLEEMTYEQLKREKINAGSVLYKAKKRNAPADTIAQNQERFDAVVALLAEKRAEIKAEKEAAKAAEAEDATEADTESVYAGEDEELMGNDEL